MKTKQEKLTTCERRAKAFCENLQQWDGGTVTVEWKKSAMYGYNPSIMYCGGKCCNVSGCGYDKLSTALAETLRFMGNTPEEVSAIWQMYGAGNASVARELALAGWTLTQTASGKMFDVFNLSRITVEVAA